MKKITTKLSNLHKHFNVVEYEKELMLDEDIFIETPSGDYVKINALVKKHTEMIDCTVEGIDGVYGCATKHIIMGEDGWEKMENVDMVRHIDGTLRKVVNKENIGFQDAYDVSLDAPHTYSTTNGLIHHNTHIALYHALKEVLNPKNQFKKLIIVRSTVQARDMGYLKGDENQKVAVFEESYKGMCHQLTGKRDAYDKLKDSGQIEFMSTAFMRSCTLDDSIIIMDEAQNATWEELYLVSTRVGRNSKLIFCGDTRQDDLHYKKNEVSGFPKFLEATRQMSEFRNLRFTADDIVRSNFVKQFIITCERLGF